jgi:hypothetical protein
MSDPKDVPAFSAADLRMLASVLDEIIPPRPDGRLPGAGQLGIADYIDAALRKVPEMKSMIVQGLADVDALARRRHGSGFAALSREEKVQLLNEQGFVLPLTFHAYTGYYQDARVVAALGLEARPPHPKGYHMEPTDLALLDPVRQRPKTYRNC